VHIVILVLSVLATIFIAYAVAGISGFFFGCGRLDFVVFGLLGGIISGISALILWQKFFLPQPTKKEKDS